MEFFSLLSSFSSSCSPGIIYNINKQLRRRRSFDEFLFLQFINSQKSPMAIHQISRQLPQNGTKSNNWQMCYSCYKDVPWSKRISTDLPQRLEWWYVTIASIGQWWTTIKNSKTNKITLVPGNLNYKYLIPNSFQGVLKYVPDTRPFLHLLSSILKKALRSKSCNILKWWQFDDQRLWYCEPIQ